MSGLDSVRGKMLDAIGSLLGIPRQDADKLVTSPYAWGGLIGIFGGAAVAAIGLYLGPNATHFLKALGKTPIYAKWLAVVGGGIVGGGVGLLGAKVGKVAYNRLFSRLTEGK